MNIKVTLTEDMLGTVPKNKEIYKDYILTKIPSSNIDINENEINTVPDMEEKGWTGFHTDELGLFVWDYFIKGFLKHAGNVLKDSLGVKALKSKLDDFVFVLPRKIYLGKAVPDGVLERPIRVMTPQGPRVSLIRSDFVRAGTGFKFDIVMYPTHKEITLELINTLLGYGKFMGFGQFRNGGYGRFAYELVL